MKRIYFVVTLVALNAFSYAQHIKTAIEPHIEQSHIVLLDSSISLYHTGDFYISGQPDDSAFLKLKGKGLDLVINVRTPEEMEQLKREGFDEKWFLDSLGIPYVQVPIGGAAGFSPDAIKNINSAIENYPGEVMIHCRGAGRATNVLVAWLINYQNMPMNDAFTLGKQMEMRFYIEDLLGYELSFDKK
jgi:protein tyrosine phosphatase (PTP) superfamily phosphohydrolase (DUF442 family)